LREMLRVAKTGAKVIADFPNRFSVSRWIRGNLGLALKRYQVQHKLYSLDEVRIMGSSLGCSNAAIKGIFSLPQAFYTTGVGRFVEELAKAPLCMRGKYYLILTKTRMLENQTT